MTALSFRHLRFGFPCRAGRRCRQLVSWAEVCDLSQLQKLRKSSGDLENRIDRIDQEPQLLSWGFLFR
jgi:hypothetical protein